MAFSTLFAIALACAGGALTMVLGDNQWAKDHQWLIPFLWVMAVVSFVLAVASSRWFRAWFGSQDAITKKSIHQEVAGGSIAAAVGSIGAGATVVIGPVTSPGSHFQARAMPTIMCTPAGTNLLVQSLGSEVINVRLVPILSDQYVLRSRVLRYLRPNLPDTLILYSKRQEVGDNTEHEMAEFFTDLGPSVRGLEVSEMLERYIKYMNQERLVVPIELAYSTPDGAAHYRAAFSLRWTAFGGGSIDDIEPKGTRLDENPPSTALSDVIEQ